MTTGRNMTKANRHTCYLLVFMLVLLGWIVFLITLLPTSPFPRDWYMDETEILMADILGLLIIGVLIIIGMVIGRWIEATQYQKNGHYLGKSEQS